MEARKGCPLYPENLKILKGKEIMAIYHFSVKNISRSDGRSVVACAAYRSGENLIDDRQGKEQDYTRKLGVEFKKIYAPEHTDPTLLERNQLWNTVEKTETRKNSQLAREFEIAFPCELDQNHRESMLNDFCQRIIQRHNVIVDAAIHAPHTASGSNERNYHAHILLTTRSVNQNGQLDKKTREFNDYGRQEVEYWREEFADLCNHYLELVGSFERVDHRSNKARGLDLEATQHEGPKATQLRRQGIFTEISIKNDEIRMRNLERLKDKELDQHIISSENLIENIIKGVSDYKVRKDKHIDIKDKINQKYHKETSDLNIFLKKKLAQIEALETEKPWFFTKNWLKEITPLVEEYNQKNGIRNSLINLTESDKEKRYLDHFSDEEKEIYLLDIEKNISEISNLLDNLISDQEVFDRQFNQLDDEIASLQAKERKRKVLERNYIFETDETYGFKYFSHTKNSPDTIRRYYKEQKEHQALEKIRLQQREEMRLHEIELKKKFKVKRELFQQQLEAEQALLKQQQEQKRERERERENLLLKRKQEQEKTHQENLKKDAQRERNYSKDNRDDDYSPF